MGVELVGDWVDFDESERTKKSRAAWNRIPQDERELYGRVHALCCTAYDMMNPDPTLTENGKAFMREAIAFGMKPFLYWLCNTYGKENVDRSISVLRKLEWTRLNEGVGVDEMLDYAKKVSKAAAAARRMLAASEK